MLYYLSRFLMGMICEFMDFKNILIIGVVFFAYLNTGFSVQSESVSTLAPASKRVLSIHEFLKMFRDQSYGIHPFMSENMRAEFDIKEALNRIKRSYQDENIFYEDLTLTADLIIEKGNHYFVLLKVLNAWLAQINRDSDAVVTLSFPVSYSLSVFKKEGNNPQTILIEKVKKEDQSLYEDWIEWTLHIPIPDGFGLRERLLMGLSRIQSETDLLQYIYEVLARYQIFPLEFLELYLNKLADQLTFTELKNKFISWLTSSNYTLSEIELIRPGMYPFWNLIFQQESFDETFQIVSVDSTGKRRLEGFITYDALGSFSYYWDAVEIAPWNRLRGRYYKGIGNVLVSKVMEESLKYGNGYVYVFPNSNQGLNLIQRMGAVPYQSVNEYTAVRFQPQKKPSEPHVRFFQQTLWVIPPNKAKKLIKEQTEKPGNIFIVDQTIDISVLNNDLLQAIAA